MKQIGKADCQNCPLVDQEYSVASKRNGHPRLNIVLEFPSKGQCREKELMTGRDKYTLQAALPSSKLGHVNAAILCHVPRNVSEKDVSKAMQCCRPRLEADLEDSPGDIIAMGPHATRSLLHRSCDPWRGAKLPWRDRMVMPTFGLYRVRMQPQFKQIWEQDVARAQAPATFVRWPTFTYKDEATAEDQLLELERLRESEDTWGVDVETNGLSILDARLTCVGIADTKSGVSLKWPPKDPRVKREALRLLASAHPKAFHNGQFDMGVFHYNNIPVNGFTFDTLIAHSIAHPQLPHSLGFVSVQYYDHPRWKQTYKEGDDNYSDTEDNRLYNVKDCHMTALLANGPLPVAVRHRHNGEYLFDLAMRLARLTERMRYPGMNVDPAALEDWRVNLIKDLTKFQGMFADLVGKIDGIDAKTTLGKNAQNNSLRTLFFKFWDLEPDERTDLGTGKLDADFLAGKLGHPNPQIARMSRIILLYRGVSKLLSTYVNKLPVDSDGYIRSSWKVFGTITGRWSSSGPNLQNQPKKMRNIYIPSPGRWIVSADYSQLELRLQAVFSGDDNLLDLFATGRDVHLEVAKLVFGDPHLDKSTPIGKRKRNMVKGVIYGKSYGGSAKTIWKTLLRDFPQMQLALVRKVLKAYDAQYPQLAKFLHDLVATASANSFVECLLSQRREYFFDDKIEPTKVYNFPFQAGAGYEMNRSILAVAEQLDWTKGRIISQVHDEINLEVDDIAYGCDLLAKCMARPLIYNGNAINLAVEVDYGLNWKELKGYTPGKQQHQYEQEWHEWATKERADEQDRKLRQEQALREQLGS